MKQLDLAAFNNYIQEMQEEWIWVEDALKDILAYLEELPDQHESG